MIVLDPGPLLVHEDFYDSVLAGDNKVDRFHELGRQKGLPSSVVSQALERNKAPTIQCGVGKKFTHRSSPVLIE